MRKIIFYLFILVCTSMSLFAQPGTLDPSFGTGGKVVVPQLNGYSIGESRAMAIQTDGKILMTHNAYNTISNKHSFGVTRLNTDGSLDNSFSGDGRAFAEFPNSQYAYPYDIAIGQDGKIVVTGYEYHYIASNYYYSTAAARFNTDGSLDNSFDGDGLVLIDENIYSYDLSFSVDVQNDGKVLLAGRGVNPQTNQTDFKVLRLNTNGTLDNSFDGDGRAYIDFTNSYEEAWKIKVQGDGKIVLSGLAYNYINSNNYYDFAITRLNTDGSLDNSFGTGGKTLVDVGGYYDYSYGLDLQANGKIVVSGYMYNSNSSNYYDYAVIRLNTNGTLDNSFDGDGKKTIDLSTTYDICLSVAVQTDGKILLNGYVSDQTYSNYNFGIVRLNEDGSFDNSFDGDGKLLLDFNNNSYDLGYDIGLQQDGKIVVSGYSNNNQGGYGPAAARLLNDVLTYTLSCPGNQTVNAANGECTAIVNNIDPVLTPPGNFSLVNYTLTDATTGSGTGTVSGMSFNNGTTTVTYTLISDPTKTCSFTVTVNAGIDTDNDGTPDACDADDDNDGIPDANDCAPLNPSQLQALSNVSYNTAPVSISFNSPADYTFSSAGSLAGNTGGRTWFFNNINDAAYSGLWWTLNPIANPRHSSQSATGSMVFSSYNSATGIITFTSTANMVWTANSGTENIQTRLRVQLQPYSGLHSNTPLSSGWIDPVTAGLINLNSLSGSYPLIDIKAIAGLKKFQTWFILEEVSSGLPLNVYYSTFPHTSTVGGNIVTSIGGNFFGSTAGSVCNGGNGTVLISGSGGTPPYSGTGSFVVSPGTYNYTITDAAGCSSTTTVNVLPQVDETDPEITCPANIEVNTLSNACTASVTFAATATDNCSASIQYYLNYNTPDEVEITSPHVFPKGVHTVIAVATDPSGNSVTCSFTVTVNDVTQPTFTCPGAQNINLNTNCELVIPDLITGLSGSDNCGTVTFTQSPVAGTALSSSHNQNHNVVITADDGNGNTTQCTVVLTGKDVTDPTFNCPNAQNVNLNATCQLVVPDLVSGLTGNDNCGTVTFTQSPVAGTALSSSHNQTHNVVITADDGNGNTTQCTVVLTGKDVTDPTFTCPNAQNVNINATCQLVVPDLVSGLTGNDNCGTVTFTQSPVAGTDLSSSHNQTHNVAITADDGNGNTTQCTVVLTGKDVIDPTFNCPNAQDVNLNATCQLLVPDLVSALTGNDNCGTVTFTQSPVAGSALSSSHDQTHNVVITADDGNGNTTQCTVILTGKDVTQPTFTTCPSDITVNAATGQCSQVVNFIIAATDNCSGSASASVSSLTGDIVNSDFNNATSGMFSPAATTSKLTFTTGGYAHSHSGAISVYVDIHNASTNTWVQIFAQPIASGGQFSFSGLEISFPSQLVDQVRLRSSVGQNQTFHGWNPVTLTLSSEGVAIVSSHPSGFNFPVGTTTVTNTATDAAGNTATCSFNVIVEDKEAPAVTAPSTVDLECSGDLPAAATTITEFLALAGATATDNCTAQSGLTVSSSDGTLAGTNCNGTITRTYTITDGAGNATSVDHVFTVTDNTIPVINTCPGDGTTFIRNSNSGQCTYKVVGVEFDAAGTDNCSGVTMSYSIANEHTSAIVTGTGSLANIELSFGLNTITWIATDACGNASVSCVVKVDVDKITTTTTLTVNPASQQYSDKVTLTATVTPYNCTGAGDIGGTVTFKIGTFVLGTANVVIGTATLTTALLEDQLYDANLNDPMNATNGPLKPGSKTVTAHFNNTDPDYIVINPTAQLTVTCEDADITYNGQTYFTVSPNTNSGTVVLSNYVVDRNDTPTGARGDIRNATSTFWNNAINGSVLGAADIPVGLVNPDNKQEGFVTTSFNDVLSNTDITNGGKVYEVWSGLNNYYCGVTDTYTPVTLGLPGQDFVTGGGYIVFGNNSAGTYAGTSGKRMNFGFVMRWNSSGKNLQGRVNVVYRKMVNGVQRIYQIKSNAINSLVVENVNDAGTPASGTNIKFRRATISTKANLADITDPLNPISLGGNLSLTLIGWESTTVTTGALDRISVQLSGSGSIGLLFSSNWSSGKTIHQTLNGGKIQVRNPASPAPGQRVAPEVTANVIQRPFAVKALPNPSTSHFNLLVEGNNKEEVYIKVYNGNGALIEHTKGMANQNYILGNSWISGIYIVQIQQGKELKSVKLVKL